MSINYVAVAVATIAQFMVGGLWYMMIFQKPWSEMHGFDKLSKAEQKAKQAKMMPEMVGQIAVTALTVLVLAKLLVMLPNESGYKLAVMSWIGFVIPTQFAAVVFGGTESKWVGKKLTIMALGSLACLLVGAFVLQAIK